jgi:hypothetical protein
MVKGITGGLNLKEGKLSNWLHALRVQKTYHPQVTFVTRNRVTSY